MPDTHDLKIWPEHVDGEPYETFDHEPVVTLRTQGGDE